MAFTSSREVKKRTNVGLGFLLVIAQSRSHNPQNLHIRTSTRKCQHNRATINARARIPCSKASLTRILCATASLKCPEGTHSTPLKTSTLNRSHGSSASTPLENFANARATTQTKVRDDYRQSPILRNPGPGVTSHLNVESGGNPPSPVFFQFGH